MDETYLAFSKLADVMSDPEWAHSTAKNQTAFVRAHGQTVFDRARSDVRRFLFAHTEPVSDVHSPSAALYVLYASRQLTC